MLNYKIMSTKKKGGRKKNAAYTKSPRTIYKVGLHTIQVVIRKKAAKKRKKKAA